MSFGTVILLLLVIFIIYEYFVDKGAILCQVPIINWFCKCPTDSEKDPDGKCYECPVINGYQSTRNANAVTSPSACTGDCGKMYPGGFEDGLSGYCWSCPSGYNRTTAPVTADNACALNNCTDKYPGTFSDITIPGCWKCPSDYPCRVITQPVNSPNACGVCGQIGGKTVPAQNMGSNISTATKNGPMTFPASFAQLVMF